MNQQDRGQKKKYYLANQYQKKPHLFTCIYIIISSINRHLWKIEIDKLPIFTSVCPFLLTALKVLPFGYCQIVSSRKVFWSKHCLGYRNWKAIREQVTCIILYFCGNKKCDEGKETRVNKNEINLSEFNLNIPLYARLIDKQMPSL